jgi:hypothetical protein
MHLDKLRNNIHWILFSTGLVLGLLNFQMCVYLDGPRKYTNFEAIIFSIFYILNFIPLLIIAIISTFIKTDVLTTDFANELFSFFWIFTLFLFLSLIALIYKYFVAKTTLTYKR